MDAAYFFPWLFSVLGTHFLATTGVHHDSGSSES